MEACCTAVEGWVYPMKSPFYLMFCYIRKGGMSCLHEAETKIQDIDKDVIVRRNVVPNNNF
jgi:hypothetical protein